MAAVFTKTVGGIFMFSFVKPTKLLLTVPLGDRA
jgi:hypothetical protein